MKKIIFVIMSVMLLLSCDNKSRQTEPINNDDQVSAEQSESDIIASSVQEEVPEVKEKPSTPISYSASSSRSHKSSSYDNMRGFDPASEDDMDDNSMRRYMENDDDEGWD